MKKLSLFAVLALGLSACAPSQTNALVDVLLPKSAATMFTPANPGWIYRQFFLDAATRAQACKAGYAAASVGSVPIAGGQVTFTSTDGKVTFQNNFRDTAEVCRTLALKGNALPDSVPPQGVDLYYSASKPDVPAPLTLVFADAGGQELTRISVPAGINYSWGKNLPEGFFTVGQKSALANATSFKLLVNFGRGIETFEIIQDRLN